MKQTKLYKICWMGILFPALLLTLLLAACGSNEEAATPTAAPTETRAPTETSAPMVTPVTDQSVAAAPPAILPGTVTETVGTPESGPIEGSLLYSGLSRNHRPDRITYPMNPPVGGDHNPAWLNCGVYTVTLPAELAVHSLEHGAVWITYLPDLPADQVTTLKALTKAGDFRLLSPNPGQDSPIIMTAWGVQLKLQSTDDPRVQEFIGRYENPTDGPEYGAPCSGAYGQPEQ